MLALFDSTRLSVFEYMYVEAAPRAGRRPG